LKLIVSISCNNRHRMPSNLQTSGLDPDIPRVQARLTPWERDWER
jgi:hypothetical protein